MRGRGRAMVAALAFACAIVVTSCSASNDTPSPGTYTVQFPSTAAAVATDTVQLLVFETPKTPAERTGFCQTLIQARKRKDPQKPALTNAPVNICEMLQGRKPITLAYGEKAILAVAQRRAVDFLIGCTIETLGDGPAPLPIELGLIDVGNPVPDTTCTTVGDFCAMKCPAQ